ncbi:MAG TPA: BolA family protein [Steroidobacteraceae bacterium]|nr:BolA family protein [Steroidobacteraceae bacterium]
MSSLEERLRERLVAEFAPLELSVVNESHLHAGHAGAAAGGSHFRVRIVSEAFRGKPPLECHRAVYAAIAELLKHEIHAVAIEARPPPGE